MQKSTPTPVLEVENLEVTYFTRLGPVKAVRDVSFEIWPGDAMGLVGESGCGKSTLAFAIMNHVARNAAVTGGRILFRGDDMVQKSGRQLDRIRGNQIAMVYQDPMAALNPRRTVGEAIARPLQLFGTVPGTEIQNVVVRLLEAVRLGEGYLDRLPRQLSGGEKQRVALARAFAGRPTLALCDEPLSSLDVSVQAAVINPLLEFQQRFETTMLFISHDLSVVYQFCDSVAVMYLGRICEVGSTEALFAPPYHPYTEALLSAVPVPDPSVERTDIRLAGAVPSALDPPSGCRFHTRCPRKLGPVCERESPPWRQVTKEHRICCHIDTEALRAVKPVFERKEP